MSELQCENTIVSPCKTFHLYNNEPLYPQRFYRVLKFHEPGLASVKDNEGAYHIHIDGQPAYSNRFIETFGFYEGVAAVQDKSGWFHILPDGSSLYEARYAWCGNFQNSACVVKNMYYHFFHIDHVGKRLYKENFNYAGDFRDGTAVIQNQKGFYSHITSSGELLHSHWFLDLDVFHKEFARAKDKKGWFHIDCRGEAIYPERYAMVEPFYNGIARVENEYGEILRINEQGSVIEKLRQPLTTPFQSLSADIVGYWRTQTIKAAVDLNIFEHLPSKLEELSQKINVNKINTQRLLRALIELGLVKPKNEYYELTQLSQYLTKDHHQSLYEAVKHWGQAHYLAWMHLSEAIKEDKPAYAKIFNDPLFDWLDKDKTRLLEYQRAMSSYARHDYPELVKLMDLSNYETVIDAGGGEGTLLQQVLYHHLNLSGVLLERPSVVENIIIPPALTQRMRVIPFDLFKPWPQQSDVIILSRVLHDWNDVECGCLLQNAYHALNEKGRILIIEMLLDDADYGNGGMLDMNMLVITGGKERTLAQYQALTMDARLIFSELKSFGNYCVLVFHKND